MKNDFLRRINLDFHTSEHIPDVGSRFNAEKFKEALLSAHVNSITLFAKCHHGYAYFDSKVVKRHPNLKFDLLSEQIKTAHSIGVKTPIYITLGWSAKDIEEHPEWGAKDFFTHEQVYYRYDKDAKPTDPKPFCSWKVLCPHTAYKKMLVDFTKEICEKYAPIDGIFYDICFIGDACGCPDCIKGMVERGYDPTSLNDGKKYYIEKRIELFKELRDLVKSYNSEASVFFNGGADMDYPQYHEFQTHFELEDLPSVWGGYDRLPIRAKFFSQSYDKTSIGMTGKFHTSWGEFGGYKKTNALKYECANMLALGCGCSIGDQLHPSGDIDIETYRRIGTVYKYIEDIEPYCYDVKDISKVGLILSNDRDDNEGVSKMLMEHQKNFILIFEETDISMLETIIVPNNPKINASLRDKIRNFYTKQNGKLLLIGNSIKDVDFVGIKDLGQSEYDMDYIKATKVDIKLTTPFLAYQSARKVKLDSTYSVIAEVYEPYFSRTYEHYCSHRNTPNKLEPASYPGAALNDRVCYIAHNIPAIYNQYGSAYHRCYFNQLLEKVSSDDYCSVKGLFTCGRMYFTGNDDHYALHLFYASPVLRGEANVIEDIVPIYNIEVNIQTDCDIKKVYKVPQNEPINFTKTDKGISFVVDKISNHQLIIIKK